MVGPPIRRLLRKKERAFNQAKKTSKPMDWHRFRTLKKTAKKTQRQAYWNYINNIVDPEDNKTSNKGFWSFLKKLKTDSAGISVLKKDGQTAISSQEKAEMLNNQFRSVFTNEDTSNIPQPEGKISPDIHRLWKAKVDKKSIF